MHVAVDDALRCLSHPTIYENCERDAPHIKKRRRTITRLEGTAEVKILEINRMAVAPPPTRVRVTMRLVANTMSQSMK